MQLSGLLSRLFLVVLCAVLPAEARLYADPREPGGDLEKESQRLLQLEAQLLEQLERGTPSPSAGPSEAPTTPASLETPQARQQAEEPSTEEQPERQASSEPVAAPTERQEPVLVKKASLRSPIRAQENLKIEKTETPAVEERNVGNSGSDMLGELARLDASLQKLHEEDLEIKRMLESLTREVRDTRGTPRLQAFERPAPQLEAPLRPKSGLIALVVEEPAVLRSGPSRNSARIMSVNRGTRMAVTLHQGQWYQVVAPGGFEAWLPGDVLNVWQQE